MKHIQLRTEWKEIQLIYTLYNNQPETFQSDFGLVIKEYQAVSFLFTHISTLTFLFYFIYTDGIFLHSL